MNRRYALAGNYDESRVDFLSDDDGHCNAAVAKSRGQRALARGRRSMPSCDLNEMSIIRLHRPQGKDCRRAIIG